MENVEKFLKSANGNDFGSTAKRFWQNDFGLPIAHSFFNLRAAAACQMGT
jgi:hypothetical protein